MALGLTSHSPRATLTVADSPSPMARNMKAEVREKLAQGWDSEKILQHFERSYGEFVRLEPPLRGVNWLVWAGPLLALAAGGAVVSLALRRSAGREAESGPVPARDTLPGDPRLATAVRDVRRLAYGWPEGTPPEEGSP